MKVAREGEWTKKVAFAYIFVYNRLKKGASLCSKADCCYRTWILLITDLENSI